MEEQSHNSDDSDADSEEVRKAKKLRKLVHEKWSGSLICKLLDEYKSRLCLWNIFLIRHRKCCPQRHINFVYNFTQ